MFFLMISIIMSGCIKEDSCDDEKPITGNKNMILVVKNLDATAINTYPANITNLQILLFDANGICLKTIPLNNVVFDETSVYTTTLDVTNDARSITVLANAIGYTYPNQDQFVGATLADIFVATTHDASVPGEYFIEPLQLFEGGSPIKGSAPNQEVTVNVGITRLISNIVVKLGNALDFNAYSGKGFKVQNALQDIYINNIDSMFIVDTPAGVNLTVTEYLSDAIGFDFAQIYKPTNFKATSNVDNCFVFPQIDAPALPYIILSVNGTRGTTPINSQNPLYYGMRLKNITLNGVPTTIKSLPRNVVVVVTIDSFKGDGASTHPNPDEFESLVVNVSIQSWDEYYDANGDMQ